MSNVVQLRLAPVEELEPSTFADAWSVITDTMKRRSESKAKCEVMWNREAKRLGGQALLLGKLKTYMRDDKDVIRTGGPGLQVVLKSGRLEHWMAQDAAAPVVGAFPHAEARADVKAFKGEAFCRSYLDRCKIEGTTLIVATETAAIKLREAGAVLKQHGFTGMKIQKNRPPRSL